MRVLKFGGSSVASPERIRIVTNIILDAAQDEPVFVVVSAFQGISNQLLLCGQMAAAGNPEYEDIFNQIVTRHIEAINILIPNDNTAIHHQVEVLLNELNEILQGILLLKDMTPGALDHIASFGERLSASIITAYINKQYPAEYVDARKLIITDNTHTRANVIFDKTNAAIRQYYDDCKARQPIIPIMTGFISSSVDGRTTTLGRNSSDYTATIIGAALSASRIEIWTDVDGIYSADPHFVPSAFIVPQLSFEEAIELSYFGAKILHPSTFTPVTGSETPILIKNTLNPHAPGTLISNKEQDKPAKKWIAKSITAIDDITLLIWKGHSDIDVSVTIERLFKALTSANINIFLILEGSPKHTISLAISHFELEKAKAAIFKEFHLEIQHQLISIEEKHSQCIIAIIGDEMKSLSPDVAGRMFQALGKLQININAIIQGASERNISLLIDASQRDRALNFIHQAFFSENKSLSLIVIGAGRIGSGLLQQITQQQAALLAKKIDISVCAITNSKKMIINHKGINLSDWKQSLLNSNEAFDAVKLLKSIPKIKCNNIALVDCTASSVIVDTYPMFIKDGIHVITPNKRANVLPLAKWNKLMALFNHHHCQFLCRTNVGAGLPILTVLEDLLACGDLIIKIEGMLSGTLSYLFNHYNGSTPFSDILKQARTLTLTEPDPREDLSGIDVARKLLILARKMGWEMELEDVKVQNLVPIDLQGGPFTEAFFEDFKPHEANLRERVLACKANNQVLRYIGTLENNRATAELQALPFDHPLALSVHSDNIVSFTTRHYRDAPLVIRGPGAGVECTALGVFSDILKLLNNLPNI